LRFRFKPKREKNRTKPDLQTLDELAGVKMAGFEMAGIGVKMDGSADVAGPGAVAIQELVSPKRGLVYSIT
jgi:hypothetical protein